MDVLAILLQVTIALGVANVWILRSGRPTPFRPDGADSLAEEFARYGFPAWVYRAVGALKLSLAVLLVVGVRVESVTQPAAILMAVLMSAAIAAHLRIGDPWSKAVPASLMLVMSAAVAVIHSV